MTRSIIIDPFSWVPLYLKAKQRDNHLSVATGIPYRFENEQFLITNWHVASGRHPETGQSLQQPSAVVPDRIAVLLHVDGQLGEWAMHELSLNDPETDESIWFQHPTEGQRIDVAAIPLECPDGLTAYPMNEQPSTDDMWVEVGHDVFILGYPLGMRAGGVLPVWKRASIASEPDLPLDELPKMLVDTATREGMSGSPVIHRAWGSYRQTGGNIIMGAGVYTRFLGIYSGRIGADDEFKAQIGIVWDADVIEEILAAKQPGSYELIERERGDEG